MRTYPEDSLQAVIGEEWWQKMDKPTICRGQLVKVFLPHVEQQARVLTATRADEREHGKVDFKVDVLRATDPPRSTGDLPVAALPKVPGEVWMLHRAKMRPGVVVSVVHGEVPKELRRGQAQWQSAPTVLVAPMYGAAQDGSRGGWNQPFVTRIRRCEFPQYMWDHVPDADTESIIRFDHLQPVGNLQDNLKLTPYKLTDVAIECVNDWIVWMMTGLVPDVGLLNMARTELLKLAGDPPKP